MSTVPMIILHALCFASVIFVGIRFFRLFPKAQPPSIGPLKPPPGPVIHATLYVIWAVVTIVFGLILAGGLF
jgi:fumarate reductase subunit C